MLEKIKTNLALRLIDKKTLSLTSPELYDMFRGVYSMMFQPGQPIYSDISTTKAVREGYKLAVPIYRGIRAVIQAISGIPWYAANQDGEEIEKHSFTKVWARPNPEFSGQDNMEYLIAHLLLGGVSYLRPIMVSGIPAELWIEMPDLIQPIPSKDRNKWIDGWQYTINANGEKVNVKKEVFIQFKQIDPGNFYTGIGAVQPAGRIIDTYNEGIDTQKVSMQNRGLSSGILYPDGDGLDSGQFDDFKQKFKDNYTDKASRREPWLFPRKIGWIETSQTPVELDYNQSQLGLIRQMAAAIGIDPWWVGDREHSSYNNVKEARRSLYEDVGIPILDDIKATLNLKVAPMYGDNCKILYDLSNVAALREDYGQKVTQAQTLWQMGVPMSQINTVLEMGLAEYSGWDRSYLPFSVAPAGTDGAIDNEQPDAEAQKSIKMTEDEIKVEWKRVDSRRVAYWAILQKKFEPLYRKTGEAVIKALGNKPDKKKIDKAIDSLEDDWIKMIIATGLVVIEDFGKQTEMRLKAIKPAECKFDPFADYVQKWLKAYAAKQVVSVSDTLKDDMGALITKGVEDGLSNKELARVLREYYDDRSYSMAMRIARTETASAAGYAQHQTALDLGYKTKIWVSARDDRTRDSHARMDGQTKDINSRYSNGLMYPGDPSGSADEIINCRCIERWGR